MSTVLTDSSPSVGSSEIELVTFYLGDLLLGLDIDQVQEINRLLNVTSVPDAPDCIRGVINLRGDVATVVDLRSVLGLPKTKKTISTRNLVVNSEGEVISLWVDQVSDIVTIPLSKITSPPVNVNNIDSRFFTGVSMEENEILVILNLEEILKL